MQVGDSLEEFLLAATPDPKLRQVMMSLSEAIRTIAFKVCSGTSACPGVHYHQDPDQHLHPVTKELFLVAHVY